MPYIRTDRAYKEYQKLWHNNPRDKVYNDFPLRLEIELVYPAMEDALFDMIMRECRRYGLYSLRFGVHADPLLHSQIGEYVKQAKEAGITEVIIRTSGKKLTATLIRQLIDARLDRLEIIASAYSQDVVDNLLLVRKFRRGHIPQIVVRTASTDGWETAADQFQSLQLYDYTTLPPDHTIKKPDCPAPFRKLVIVSTGDVVPCECSISSYKLGNVYQTSLYTIWEGDEMVRLRLLTSNNAEICLCCPKRRQQNL